MRALLAIAFIGFSVSSSFAACYGTDDFQTCNDAQSGNHYTIQKYGDTTTMHGNNYNTGSTWSQTTQQFGDMSATRGVDADGNSWNRTCVGAFCN